MGVSIGGIDVVGSIINLEYKVERLGKILDWILNNNPGLTARYIPPEQMREIDDAVIRVLQQKYPNAGIRKTEDPT